MKRRDGDGRYRRKRRADKDENNMGSRGNIELKKVKRKSKKKERLGLKGN